MIFCKVIWRILKKRIETFAGGADRAKALTNLYGQKAQALANNDQKTAALIERIIQLIEKKGKK
jgi:hypothetical protein